MNARMGCLCCRHSADPGTVFLSSWLPTHILEYWVLPSSCAQVCTMGFYIPALAASLLFIPHVIYFKHQANPLRASFGFLFLWSKRKHVFLTLSGLTLWDHFFYHLLLCFKEAQMPLPSLNYSVFILPSVSLFSQPFLHLVTGLKLLPPFKSNNKATLFYLLFPYPYFTSISKKHIILHHTNETAFPVSI